MTVSIDGLLQNVSDRDFRVMGQLLGLISPSMIVFLALGFLVVTDSIVQMLIAIAAACGTMAMCSIAMFLYDNRRLPTTFSSLFVVTAIAPTIWLYTPFVTRTKGPAVLVDDGLVWYGLYPTYLAIRVAIQTVLGSFIIYKLLTDHYGVYAVIATAGFYTLSGVQFGCSLLLRRRIVAEEIAVSRFIRMGQNMGLIPMEDRVSAHQAQL